MKYPFLEVFEIYVDVTEKPAAGNNFGLCRWLDKKISREAFPPQTLCHSRFKLRGKMRSL